MSANSKCEIQTQTATQRQADSWLDTLAKLTIPRLIKETRWTTSEKGHPTQGYPLASTPCTSLTLTHCLKSGEAGDGNQRVGKGTAKSRVTEGTRRIQGVVVL